MDPPLGPQRVNNGHPRTGLGFGKPLPKKGDLEEEWELPRWQEGG